MANHLAQVTLHPDRFPTDEHYPFNLPLFRRTSAIGFPGPVTLFVGENGTGKSTLLEAIARKCGIHIWQEERTRYRHNPYEHMLAQCISVQWLDGSVPGSFFGSGIFQDFARLLDEWAAADPGQLRYFGGKSLMEQSHGQSLMAYFRARYKLRGLYLLDEPETALSPRTQLELLGLLSAACEAGNAQFIIATHSPILLSCPEATIHSFDGPAIERVQYEDTDHYRIYRDFMADPAGYGERHCLATQPQGTSGPTENG